MRRVYRLLISTLVILGIVAIAPAKTPVDKTEQAISMVKAGCCDTDQIASADVKKKKKKVVQDGCQMAGILPTGQLFICGQ